MDQYLPKLRNDPGGADFSDPLCFISDNAIEKAAVAEYKGLARPPLGAL